MSDRLSAARDYVARKPTDRFGLYTLGMELRKVAAWSECFSTFDRLIEHHPDYGAAWYHYGMARYESGDKAGALRTLRGGLPACDRTSDARTRTEILGAVETIEASDDEA